MKSFRKTFRKSFIKKKPLRKASAKAQSAMEYLMTYGWAILIISVVLAALFQLGVFNPMTFAPKAPPGSCQVLRPNGPGTTSFINLEGICSGELPQYVAQFNGTRVAVLNVPSQLNVPNLQQVTMSFWYKPLAYSICWPGVAGFGTFAQGTCGYNCFRVYTCTSGGVSILVMQQQTQLGERL